MTLCEPAAVDPGCREAGALTAASKYYAGDLPAERMARLVALDHPERLRDLDQ